MPKKEQECAQDAAAPKENGSVRPKPITAADVATAAREALALRSPMTNLAMDMERLGTRTPAMSAAAPMTEEEKENAANGRSGPRSLPASRRLTDLALSVEVGQRKRSRDQRGYDDYGLLSESSESSPMVRDRLLSAASDSSWDSDFMRNNRAVSMESSDCGRRVVRLRKTREKQTDNALVSPLCCAAQTTVAAAATAFGASAADSINFRSLQLESPYASPATTPGSSPRSTPNRPLFESTFGDDAQHGADLDGSEQPLPPLLQCTSPNVASRAASLNSASTMQNAAAGTSAGAGTSTLTNEMHHRGADRMQGRAIHHRSFAARTGSSFEDAVADYARHAHEAPEAYRPSFAAETDEEDETAGSDADEADDEADEEALDADEADDEVAQMNAAAMRTDSLSDQPDGCKGNEYDEDDELLNGQPSTQDYHPGDAMDGEEDEENFLSSAPMHAADGDENDLLTAMDSDDDDAGAVISRRASFGNRGAMDEDDLPLARPAAVAATTAGTSSSLMVPVVSAAGASPSRAGAARNRMGLATPVRRQPSRTMPSLPLSPYSPVRLSLTTLEGDNSCNRITPATLAQLIRTQSMNYIIIDCRFPYEFQGGHIRGAKNLMDQGVVRDYLFENPIRDEKTAIIFHCEFSSVRGPAMYDAVRKKDRRIHEASYPRLYYPDLYLLEGGYKKFYAECPELCDPVAYTEMNDERYIEECQINMRRLRDEKRREKNQRRNSRAAMFDPSML